FVTAIKSYGRAGMLNEALSLFKNLREFNCVDWTQSFNTLLEMLVKESKLEAAHRLFLENSHGWEVKSRIKSLNLLMDALCVRGNSLLVLQLFQEMDYQGCHPDKESYQILMKGLCEERRLNEATHLLYSMFWRISQKGSGEDIVVYRTLLNALCDNGQVEEALEILGKILRKGLKAPKRHHQRFDLSECGNDRGIESAKNLINEALIKGCIPSLALDFYGEGRVIEAEKVVHEMRRRGFWPLPLMYEAKVAALCREGSVSEAVKVLEEEMAEGNCVRTVRICNVVLKGLCDAGKSELAVGYLKKMAKQVGCVANKETYGIVVDGLCRDGRFIEANRISEEMLIKSYCPCDDTYNVLIRGLCSMGRQYEAVMLLEEMVSLVFVTAIKSYGRAGMLNEALSLFKNLREFNCVDWTQSFNTLLEMLVKESKLEAAHRLFLENSHGWEVKSRIKSLNLLMDALCVRGNSLLALQLFQEMDYQGCHPDKESYQILMKGLCEERRLNEATHLLYSMFWRISQKGSGEDIVVYRTLLNALCDNGQVEEALEILGKILRKGLKAPKRRHQRFDLSECGDDRGIESAKNLINEALIKGCIPSLASYSAMALDFYSEGRVIEAEKVVHEMRCRGFWPSPLMYEAKVAALCREGSVSEAVKVLEEEMAEGNCVPTVRICNVVLKGLCDAGKSELAVGYLKKMAKQVGCVANKETYGIVVDGLCRDGKFIEANRILEEMLIKSYCPCDDTYNILIRGLCSMGRQYEAVMLLEEMVSQGKLPHLSIWNSLV
ncbi:PPR domain-containing protein/PPR_2 domain-containing protein, partial [Cephalotus follicularis]